MGEAGAKVTGGVDGVAGQAAEGHTDGHDDAEHDDVALSTDHAVDLGKAEDGEGEHEGTHNFAEEVAGTVGDGGGGAEAGALEQGVFGGVEMVSEEEPHEHSAAEGTGHLSHAVAEHHGPGEHAANGEGDGQSGVEMRTGGSAEDADGQKNGQTPGEGDLHRAGALEAGAVEEDVGHDTVAKKDEEHGAEEFTNIRHV